MNIHIYKDLPEYLGFGILNKESVKRHGRKIIANYCADGEIVYIIEWAEGLCTLKSFFGGELLFVNEGTDLHQAFFKSMIDEDNIDNFRLNDPRLANVITQVSSRGNVYFVYPRPRQLFYPAGLIFNLRLPLVETENNTWKTLKQKISDLDAPLDCPLRFENEQPGLILRLSRNKKVSAGDITIIDFTVLLFNLVKAINICSESGLIPSSLGKEYRLVISISEVKSLLVPGDSTSNTLVFSVLTYNQDLSIALYDGKIVTLEDLKQQFLKDALRSIDI